MSYKYFAIFTLLSISLMNLCVAVDGQGMPPEAQKILDRLEKDTVALKSKAISELDKVLVNQTKKGALENANAMKAIIDKIKTEIQQDALSDPYVITPGKYSITIIADDSADIIINGRDMGIFGTTERTVEVTLDAGLQLLAKCEDAQGGKFGGLMIKVISANGKVVLSTDDIKSWATFKPRDDANWTNMSNVTEIKGAIKGYQGKGVWADGFPKTCFVMIAK